MLGAGVVEKEHRCCDGDWVLVWDWDWGWGRCCAERARPVVGKEAAERTASGVICEVWRALYGVNILPMDGQIEAVLAICGMDGSGAPPILYGNLFVLFFFSSVFGSGRYRKERKF